MQVMNQLADDRETEGKYLERKCAEDHDRRRVVETPRRRKLRVFQMRERRACFGSWCRLMVRITTGLKGAVRTVRCWCLWHDLRQCAFIW